MLEVGGIRLPLAAFAEGSKAGRPETIRQGEILPASLETILKKATAAKLGIDVDTIISVSILKRSVDARKKHDVHFVATVAAGLRSEKTEVSLCAQEGVRTYRPYTPLEIPWIGAQESRPYVIGMGPAGLFAALYLARAGLRPILVERGPAVEARHLAVERFLQTGELDMQSNIQFGEGGAGTFSDGKLTTNVKNPYCSHVLHWFVEAGAPPEILWHAKPHMGTDRLPQIVATMREQIIDAGGEVHFSTKLEQLIFSDEMLSEIVLQNVMTGEMQRVPAKSAVLACGHSARDTFTMLFDAGIVLEPKPFSVGVRIEHPQRAIDSAQYGDCAGHPALGSADYKLAVHLENGRGIYTFCMCPGGEVVCAASEEAGIVVNGMSTFARDGTNANAAVLVGVGPDDFGTSGALAGMGFQRRIEQAAYQLALAGGAAPYQAPAQTVGDFLRQKSGNASSILQPSYARGVIWADLRRCLPEFVVDALMEALPLLDRKLRGFAMDGAVLTGVETRSSSPVRIVRGARHQASVHGFAADQPSGLYVCGEGSGYAGGIMSAAADGLRTARFLAEDYGIGEL